MSDGIAEALGAAQRIVGAEQRRRNWARAEIAKAGLWYDAVTAVTPEGDAILERFPGEPIPVFTRFEPKVGDLVLGGWVGRPEDAQPVVFGALPDDGARFAVRDADGRPVLTADPVARTVTFGGPVVDGSLRDAAVTSVVNSHSGDANYFGHLSLGLTIPAGETHTVLARAFLSYNSTKATAILAILLDGAVVASVNQVVVANDFAALAVAKVVTGVGPGAHTLQVGFLGTGTTGVMAGRAATIDYTTKRTA